MPNPHAFVAGVQHIGPATEPPDLGPHPRGTGVKFDDGRNAVIEPESANAGWIAALLTELHQNQLPAYVELSPVTGAIVDVHVPLVARVNHVEVMGSGDADVRLATSAARHTLHRSQPDFDELLTALRQARVS